MELVLVWIVFPIFLIVVGQMIFDPWHFPKKDKKE